MQRAAQSSKMAAASKNAKCMSMAVSDMLGADVETGGVWDPLGFSKDEASLFRRRAVELKHGRICMLATFGVLVQSFYHLPDPVFSNPRPLGALLQVDITSEHTACDLIA
eukprot:2060-Heterococcus_DN1.PRE.2